MGRCNAETHYLCAFTLKAKGDGSGLRPLILRLVTLTPARYNPYIGGIA